MMRHVFTCWALVGVLGSASSAAIIGTATLVKNPPTIPFGAPSAALGAPWQSYVLSVQATAGETIQVIQAVFNGNMHQHWDEAYEYLDFAVESAKGVGRSGGDSHLLVPPGSPFGSGPRENNPGTGSPLSASNSASITRGVGNLLTGAWSLTGANVGSSADVAYLVVNRENFSSANFNIEVKVANPSGEILDTLTWFDFIGLPNVDGLPPTVADLFHSAPMLGELFINLTPTDSRPGTPPVTWSALTGPTYVPGFGVPLGTPIGLANFSWDPATQAFQFARLGARRGTYTWSGAATNVWGSDPFKITIEVTPEPATVTLLVLAMVGFVGCARRR